MLDLALNYLCDRLSSMLQRRAQQGPCAAVVLGMPPENPGSAAGRYLQLQLVNIEQDYTPWPHQRASTVSARVERFSPVYLNLYLLISSQTSAGCYGQGLSDLSQVIEFFQQHPVLDSTRLPDLPEGIDRLCLDIENLDSAAVSSLWQMLGCSYRPSVLYKLRMVAVGGDAVAGQQQLASDVELPAINTR